MRIIQYSRVSRIPRLIPPRLSQSFQAIAVSIVMDDGGDDAAPDVGEEGNFGPFLPAREFRLVVEGPEGGNGVCDVAGQVLRGHAVWMCGTDVFALFGCGEFGVVGPVEPGGIIFGKDGVQANFHAIIESDSEFEVLVWSASGFLADFLDVGGIERMQGFVATFELFPQLLKVVSRVLSEGLAPDFLVAEDVGEDVLIRAHVGFERIVSEKLESLNKHFSQGFHCADNHTRVDVARTIFDKGILCVSNVRVCFWAIDVFW